MKNPWKSRTLYELKKRYSKIVTICYDLRETVNVVQGRRTVDKKTLTLKAIVLPTSMHKKFAYDIAFLAANKNFTYGGFFTERALEIIFPIKELKGLELGSDNTSYLIVDNVRYNIKKTEKYEDDEMYSIVAISDSKELPSNVYTESVSDTLNLYGIGETT